MRRAGAATALAMLAMLASGCFSMPKDALVYDPALKKGDVEDLKPLTIKIAPFEDKRRAFDDGPLWPVVAMMVPLVPFGTETFDLYVEAHPERGQNSPHPEIYTAEAFAKARKADLDTCRFYLGKELRASEAFELVDDSTDKLTISECDVVLRGTLTSTRADMTVISYGLGIGSLILIALPVPWLHNTIHLEYDVTIEDARTGKAVATVHVAGEDCGAGSLYWGVMMGDMKTVMGAKRAAHAQAVKEIVAKLRESELWSNVDEVVRDRRRRSVEKIDAELPKFREALEGKRGALDSDARRRIARTYRTKLALLESLRLVEEELRKEEHAMMVKVERDISESTATTMNAVVKAQRDEMLRQLADGVCTAVQACGAGGAGGLKLPAGGKAVDVAGMVKSKLDSIEQAAGFEARAKVGEQQVLEFQDAVLNELKAHLDESMKPFLALSGTRAQLYLKWLEKYRETTPTFEQALAGK